jgi:hypothetical protein
MVWNGLELDKFGEIVPERIHPSDETRVMRTVWAQSIDDGVCEESYKPMDDAILDESNKSNNL